MSQQLHDMMIKMDHRESIETQRYDMHNNMLGYMLYYLQGLGMPPLER